MCPDIEDVCEVGTLELVKACSCLQCYPYTCDIRMYTVYLHLVHTYLSILASHNTALVLNSPSIFCQSFRM